MGRRITEFKKCKVLPISLVFWILCNATTYYVRPDGNNANPGTGPLASQAWQTVSKAASEMNSPGDVVYVAPGIYPEEVEIIYSGDTTDKIFYIADTDGSEFPDIGPGPVIIDRGANTDGFILLGASYIVIDGFTIRNSNRDGIYLDTYYSRPCSHNEIKNCIIESPDNCGIYLYATADDPNYYLCNFNEIHHNKIINAGDDGIVIKGGYDGYVNADYACKYNSVYNNEIDCNGYGVYAYYGIEHLNVYNNKISTNDGIGIYLPGAHLKNYIEIYNNMIYNSEMGIYQWSGANCNYCKILFNSFYTTGICVHWEFGEIENGDLVEIKNNIFYTTSPSYLDYCLFVWDDIDMETPEINYNHYYRSATNNSYAAYTTVHVYDLNEFNNWKTDWGFDLNSTWGSDPLFKSPTDLHILQFSPCREKGIPLGAPYNIDIDGEIRDNAHPDIGADEYYSGTEIVEQRKGYNSSQFSVEVYPNPFKNATRIIFKALSTEVVSDQQSTVNLRFYDATGKIIKSFNHSPVQLFNQFLWCGDDDSGNKVSPGVYFLTISGGKFSGTKKIVIVK
ncbi:MAG: right-handed parallel beta-helix repeat-containing protein [candidate division WOR-3 bacterium]